MVTFGEETRSFLDTTIQSWFLYGVLKRTCTSFDSSCRATYFAKAAACTRAAFHLKDAKY